jgi:DNA modification methylase
VLQRAVGDELVGLCVTDPPYGVDYDGGTTKRERLAGDADEHVLGVFGVIPWAPNASAYVWHADRRARHTEDALIATGFRLSAMIIWVKNVAQFGNLGARYHQQHEPMFYATRPRAYWSKITNEVTVWQHDRAPRNEYHPTQKPVALIERAIANSSPPGALVLDPFAGSGTTVIACERLGRRCATVEISPAYCDVVVKRWADFTGGEPVLERASKRRNGANP